MFESIKGWIRKRFWEKDVKHEAAKSPEAKRVDHARVLTWAQKKIKLHNRRRSYLALESRRAQRLMS